MRNRPEYLLALAAGFKARLTHVNVNYRYTPRRGLVHLRQFRRAGGGLRLGVPRRGRGDPPAPAEGEDLDRGQRRRQGRAVRRARSSELAEEGNGGPLDIERSGDDQFFIYTGGTTGMPKGVIWTHNDLREITLAAARRMGSRARDAGGAGRRTRARRPGMRTLPAPPLMHGTGLLTAMGAMLGGRLRWSRWRARPSTPRSCCAPSTAHKPQSMAHRRRLASRGRC